jgi:hypothetical protein
VCSAQLQIWPNLLEYKQSWFLDGWIDIKAVLRIAYSNQNRIINELAVFKRKHILNRKKEREKRIVV